MAEERSNCLDSGALELLEKQQSAPWGPLRRESVERMEGAAANPEHIWCMAEVDIFADLAPEEMDAMAAAAPMKSFTAGSLVYSPHQPIEALFILKKGRVRIFRVSTDGRALTTAIINPGTIFGEMVLVGQQMHDSFAEAIDDVAVCVMSRADVQRLLLADPRIASRITEILGRRLADLERRLSDSIFKTVSERVATTLSLLAADPQPRTLSRHAQIALTHEQLAAIAGTSRETTTKVLGEFSDRGILRLSRGKVTILDPDALSIESGG